MELILKDNLYYAECDVVMIATSKESQLYIVNDDNILRYSVNCTPCIANKHIYLLSDEEIKVGDYISDGYKVWQWKDDSSLLGRKKVIASTDTSLKITKDLGDISKEEILPQLTREFIQNFVDSYNIGKHVKKVLVQRRMTFPTTNTKQVVDFEFKVSKENTVTIKIMEEEENNSQKERLYTLEELKKVYWAGLENISSNGYSGYDRTEWLEKLIKDLK